MKSQRVLYKFGSQLYEYQCSDRDIIVIYNDQQQEKNLEKVQQELDSFLTKKKQIKKSNFIDNAYVKIIKLQLQVNQNTQDQGRIYNETILIEYDILIGKVSVDLEIYQNLRYSPWNQNYRHFFIDTQSIRSINGLILQNEILGFLQKNSMFGFTKNQIFDRIIAIKQIAKKLHIYSNTLGYLSSAHIIIMYLFLCSRVKKYETKDFFDFYSKFNFQQPIYICDLNFINDSQEQDSLDSSTDEEEITQQRIIKVGPALCRSAVPNKNSLEELNKQYAMCILYNDNTQNISHNVNSSTLFVIQKSFQYIQDLYRNEQEIYQQNVNTQQIILDYYKTVPHKYYYTIQIYIKKDIDYVKSKIRILVALLSQHANVYINPEVTDPITIYVYRKFYQKINICQYMCEFIERYFDLKKTDINNIEILQNNEIFNFQIKQYPK